MKPRNVPPARTAVSAQAKSVPVRSLAAILLLAALALFLLLPSARGAGSAVVWASPTHSDQFRFTTTSGKQLTFDLKASTSNRSGSVVIEPVAGLPAGASIGTSTEGNVAKATFKWRPTLPGDYTLGFVAKTGGASAPVRTYRIRVKPNYPWAYRLTDSKLAHWAPLVKPALARAAPNASARVVTKLALTTPDTETRNLVLVLDALEKNRNETWYHVRLPMLPNNSTGWIAKSQLGALYTVDTHLYIDRAKLTATLERDGVAVFTTRIGVGKASTPTPRGQFYIRGKITDFNEPFYGPIVFSTSARSASNEPEMKNWPGGGFVGVHGTSLPELIPGRPSHGCIRMQNDAILKLAKLIEVGSPVTIR